MGQGCWVVKVVGLVGQVRGAGVGFDAFLFGEPCGCRPSSDAGGDVAGVSFQHGESPVADPGLGGGVALGEKHHTAPQRYSSTWIRSTTIVTCTWRAFASALMRSIW